jgi:hypothetical protein
MYRVVDTSLIKTKSRAALTGEIVTRRRLPDDKGVLGVESRHSAGGVTSIDQVTAIHRKSAGQSDPDMSSIYNLTHN